MKKTRTRPRGFASIVLAIVIATVSLLSAILFPVLERATERARKASCASNLKQLGPELQMHKMDYDRRFLPGVHAAAMCPRAGIEPYLKNQQVWLCPSESNDLVSGNWISHKSIDETRTGSIKSRWPLASCGARACTDFV